MKEPFDAAIAVTAGRGVSLATEGWPAAVLAVVRSFCKEAAIYYRAREDGRIADAADRALRRPRGGRQGTGEGLDLRFFV